MKRDASFFLFGCLTLACTCAPSAWLGFVDGLRGLSTEPRLETLAVEAALEEPAELDGESGSLALVR